MQSTVIDVYDAAVASLNHIVSLLKIFRPSLPSDAEPLEFWECFDGLEDEYKKFDASFGDVKTVLIKNLYKERGLYPIDIAKKLIERVLKYKWLPDSSAGLTLWKNANAERHNLIGVSLDDVETLKIELQNEAMKLQESFNDEAPAEAGDGADGEQPKKTSFRKSTTKGEARVKIIAGLTNHHKYADGSVLNQEPIKVNKFANEIDVAPSSVSKFFYDQYSGYKKYKAACRDAKTLIASLKLLNGEYAPTLLLSNIPVAD